MKVCTSCGREFPDNQKFCPNDGSALRSKAASADLIGQVVADRYHIIKKLGEGGMGAVYLGEHVKMGRKSAIKVMAAAMSQDPDAISRFNREASNASRISHPNVCQIYDFGETPDGLIYLAMEFIEGHALKDLIEHEGALDPVRAARILKQSADALQAAHDLGIVHRDIKPDNIMVVQAKDGTDVVKVVDFGIARAVGGDEPGQKVTKTGLVVGTPEYMSPEQLSGDKLDGRSDIYSLALVLYRMLTGELPFEADSAQEVMIKRLTDDPRPLAEARPDISFPPKLQLVMNVALARSAEERYQAASEFGRDTMDAVAGMAMPETRVNLAAPQGATHVMSADEVQKATHLTTQRKQEPKASRATAPAGTGPTAAPAGKKPMLVPILGGVGGLAVIGVVAALMMNRGGGGPQVPAGTAATQQQAGQTATPGGQSTTPGASATPGQAKVPVPNDPNPNPGNNKRQPNPQSQPPGNPGNPGTVPQSTSGMAQQIEDSLTAATTASQASDNVKAKRLARWVFYRAEAESKQKSDAAELFIISLGDADTAQIIDWARKGLQYATGGQRTRFQNFIRSVGGQP